MNRKTKIINNLIKTRKTKTKTKDKNRQTLQEIHTRIRNKDNQNYPYISELLTPISQEIS